jgi:hypothetical protein
VQNINDLQSTVSRVRASKFGWGRGSGAMGSDRRAISFTRVHNTTPTLFHYQHSRVP